MSEEAKVQNRCRESTARTETLSLDFNPRDLIPSVTPSQVLSKQGDQHELDAIYVPTRGRPESVARLLRDLTKLSVPVNVLPSTHQDIPSGIQREKIVIRLLPFTDWDFVEVMRSLRCFLNPSFAVPTIQWDLPVKRNYALWHARLQGYSRILLLDDDIRGLDRKRLLAGTAALSRWRVAGYFVEDFPDTSVVGHVERSVGELVQPFLSGSCLFVRTDVEPPFFPPLYNEDWIFMAYQMELRAVCSLGVIQQDYYDPFSSSATATFQEPGEIIAEGLFALLAARRYTDRLSLSVWATLLSQRQAWLNVLAGRVSEPAHAAAIRRALARASELSAEDCVRFLAEYECDVIKWKQSLKEIS